jgi:WD40 repeat protein
LTFLNGCNELSCFNSPFNAQCQQIETKHLPLTLKEIRCARNLIICSNTHLIYFANLTDFTLIHKIEDKLCISIHVLSECRLACETIGDYIIFSIYNNSELIRIKGIQGVRTFMSVLSDSSLVYETTIDDQSSIKIYNSFSSNLLLSIPTMQGNIRFFELSNNRLFVGEVSPQNSITIWNIKKGSKIKFNNNLKVSVRNFFKISSDLIVMGGEDGSLIYYYLNNDKMIQTENTKDDSILDLSIPLKDGLVAAAYSDFKIKIWKKIELKCTLIGHVDFKIKNLFSLSNNRIASVDYSKITCWNYINCNLLRRYDILAYRPILIPNDRIVYGSNSQVKILDMNTHIVNEMKYKLGGRLLDLAYKP